MTKRKYILIAICTLICCAFMTATSFAADNTVTVENSTDFMKVWKQIEKGYADDFSSVQDTTIKLEKNIDINDELSMKLEGSSELKLRLDLNGHNLMGASDSEDYFFNVGKNLNLIIEDTSSSQTGQMFVLCKDEDAGEYNAIVQIADDGQVTLESGVIKGNQDQHCGIVAVEEDGLFKMNGGMLCGNSFRSLHVLSPDESGSAVNVEDGKFIMNGGVIRDNMHWGSGAAVVIDTNNDNYTDGDFGFEMTGGLIIENDTCATGAGGVYIDDGRASFTGGTIKQNYAATGNIEHDASDDDASEIYIDTGAESCYFGGDFVCEYNNQSPLTKAVVAKTSGFNSADAPEFGGNVHIDAFTVEDGWYYNPGIVCKNIDTSAENHARIVLAEATDGIRIYTDVDESSKHYATDINLTKCFFTCAKEVEDESDMNWGRNESMCAVYDDNEFQYIGIVEADDHSEAPICLTSFNKDNFKDLSGATIPESSYRYNWDLGRRAHFIATEAAVDMHDILSFVEIEYGGGYNQSLYNLKEIKKETSASGKVYDVIYSYEVLNTVKNGSDEYRRIAYNTLELTTASNQIESTVTMNPKEPFAYNSYRTGESVEINADYPKNADCFKDWRITASESKYEDILKDVIPEEMRTKDVLTFEMPSIPSFRVMAEYYPIYSIEGEGFTAYRIDESEEVPVTAPQMEGRKIKLEANEEEAHRWTIYKVEKDGNDKVVKTDVTSKILGEDNVLYTPEFTMPAYDIEIVCSEVGNTVFNSPFATIKVNGQETMPAGKVKVPYSKDTELDVTLDETKIPEGHNFIGWDMYFVFTDGSEKDGFEFVPNDGVESFKISFSGICESLATEDLSDVREIRLTARYDNKIDFDANGGTGEMNSQAHNPDHKYRLPECEFTAPEGQRFVGWTLEPEGSAMKTGQLISVDEDITLYAIWEDIPETVSVKLYSNDGTDSEKDIKAASGEYLLPGNPFDAPDGKAFAGWSLQEDGEAIADKYITLVYDTNLYAVWTKQGHDYETTTVEPTCTAGGYDIHRCKDCGETKMDNFTEPKGHDWGEYEILKPSGCGNKGVKIRECKVCHVSETETIEMTDHDFESDFTVDQKATLDTDGSMSRHCRNCDAKADSTVIPAMGEAALSRTSYTYNKKAKKPVVALADREGNKLVKGNDFTVAYSDNIKAGTATVIIEGIGKYDGNIITDFKIKKGKQSLKIASSSRSVKYSAVKKKTQYLTAVKVTGAKGKKSFRKVSGSAKLTITKSGRIKVKKGTKKGTYRIKVKAASASTANYKYASKTRTITVKVK